MPRPYVHPARVVHHMLWGNTSGTQYGGVGVAAMLMGGKFLEYSVLLHDSVHGQELGIFIIELGVGITVFCVMIMIFYMFGERSR